ncbi:ATP-binding cassette domain-containing protein [Dubosiella newyorkensis]|uniref:ATP-binding cassette domain-containing protein n=1 Tax=Dubosiella newyorkensis TaxID=1862672 RepID=UPI00272D9EE7|nr:ABC transporter ATP-binding protein [Dubosiella newyorkensis]
MKVLNIRRIQIFTLFFSILDLLCLYGFIQAIQIFMDRLIAGHRIDQKDLLIFLSLLSGMILCGLCSQYGFNLLPVLGKKKLIIQYETQLMKEDHSFFDQHSTAFLMSLFQNEISLLGQQKAIFPVVFLYQSIALTVGTAFLLINEWRLALVLFAIIGFCFVLTRILSKKIADNTQKVYKEKNNLFQVLHEDITMHRLIRFLNKEDYFSLRFRKVVNDRLIPIEKKQANLSTQYITIYSVLSRALPLLGAGIGLIFMSLEGMEPGKILSTYALISLIQEPIMQLAETRTQKNTINTLQEAIEQVFIQHQKDRRVVDSFGSIQKTDIQIEQFQYPDSSVILTGLCFSILRGQHTKIAGPSGVGKSTLMELLKGVQGGRNTHILFNETENSMFSRKWYSQHILMVDQKPKIFKMSILENITLGDTFSKIDLDEILYTCVLQNIIDEHQDQIVDDENGLSLGQAQRVSIARMLIRKPDILILDEPVSALDEVTTSLMIDRLKQFIERYHITLIISSHNPAINTLCLQTIDLKKNN